MSTVLQNCQAEDRLVLDGVSWATYEALVADLEHAGTRLTYDQGRLEIVSPSRQHERLKRSIGRMIETMTLELGIPIDSGSATTLKRQLRQRGLEADESYYISNEPRVRDRDDLDLTVDPPPDLAIEVDLSQPLIDKLAIYADLRVPEVWSFDGKNLRILLLQSDDTYADSRNSAAFPFLPPARLESFLLERGTTDETTWIRRFRAWVREELADYRPK
ncbi:MAG: Uma2 family endonuclease [Thermoguttaceae bacterium]|nr:Uma2 family endonuclease [Thermoguttaceae bacterium]